MVRKLEGYTNDAIIVLYDFGLNLVMIQNLYTNEYLVFIGQQYRDLYLEFMDHFNDNIDYNTAARFFQPIEINYGK